MAKTKKEKKLEFDSIKPGDILDHVDGTSYRVQNVHAVRRALTVVSGVRMKNKSKVTESELGAYKKA